MRTRRRWMAAGVALVMLMASALVARAQVFESVPNDALVVVKVKNLKATSDKLAKFATDLGLAQMAPPMADPLGALEQELKITAGLDRGGDMAMAFLDPDKAGGDPERAMLLLLPVTDYKAFLANFADAKTEGEISEVTLGQSPTHYMTSWGKYAALSMNKELVAARPSLTMKVTAAASKEADAKDIIVYANVPTIRAKFLPKIAENRGKILAEVEEGMKEQPETAKFAPVVRTLVNQLINAGEAFLRDADAVTLGISLTGEGLAITGLADFQPESYIGKITSSFKNTNDLMLNGLPQGKYLVYGGGTNDPAVTGKLLDDFCQPLIDELNKMGGDEAGAVTQYIATLKKQLASVTGQTFGMVTPAGNLGQEGVFQFVNIMSGDAKAIRGSYTEMMKQQEAMMKAFGGTAAADIVKTTYSANAKTIDGVSFDLIQSQFNMAAAGPEAAGAQMMMTYMYGPNGVTVLVGDVNDKVIVAMGVNDQMLSNTVTAVKTNVAPLADDPRVKTVAGQLARRHTGVMFIAVDEWVTTGLGYAKQFGFAVPVQLPPDLPPVGVSISSEGPVMRVDSYVPNTLVQSLVAAGMQAAMQLQGGGGPGKGGGL